MPTSLLPMVPVSVMGMPEKPCRILASSTSPTVCEGFSTTGSVMKPCSNFCGQRQGKGKAGRKPEVVSSPVKGGEGTLARALSGVRGQWEMRAGPCAPTVEKVRQDSTAID